MRDEDFFQIDDSDDYKKGYVDAPFDDYRYTEEMLAEVDRMGNISEEEARLDRLRIENERIEQARAERLRRESERKEKERREKELLEIERSRKEQEEKERLERERIEVAKKERERLEKERIEKVRLENERLEKIRLEMAGAISPQSKPVPEPVPEPVAVPVPEPVAEPKPEPVTEPVTKTETESQSESVVDDSDDDYKIDFFSTKPEQKTHDKHKKHEKREKKEKKNTKESVKAPRKPLLHKGKKDKTDEPVREDITPEEIEKAVDDERLKSRLKAIVYSAIAVVVVLVLAFFVVKALIPGYDLGAGETIRLMNTDVTVPGDVSDFNRMLEGNNIGMERLYYDEKLNPGQAKSYYFSGDYYAAGFITVKNNNETKTLANECDLVQVNLEMLSSKSYANINFRYKGITPKSTKEEIIEKLGEPEAQKDKMYCYSQTGTSLYIVLDSNDNISSFNIRKQ